MKQVTGILKVAKDFKQGSETNKVCVKAVTLVQGRREIDSRPGRVWALRVGGPSSWTSHKPTVIPPDPHPATGARVTLVTQRVAVLPEGDGKLQGPPQSRNQKSKPKLWALSKTKMGSPWRQCVGQHCHLWHGGTALDTSTEPGPGGWVSGPRSGGPRLSRSNTRCFWRKRPYRGSQAPRVTSRHHELSTAHVEKATYKGWQEPNNRVRPCRDLRYWDYQTQTQNKCYEILM